MLPVDLERSAVVDLYGELTDQIEALQKLAKPYEVQIESWSADTPADQPFVVSGDRYTVKLSAREEKRKVKSMSALFKYFGKARFLELCAIALGVLDKHLPKEKHSEFIETTQTGKRTWDIIEIGKPAGNVLPFTRSKKAAA